jgi:thiol-disulfide isomerase/thioredoxin
MTATAPFRNLAFVLTFSAAATLTGCASAPRAGAPAPRTAETILAEFDGIEMPVFDADRRGEQEYVEQFRAEFMATHHRRNALIREAFLADPEHSRLEELLPERWNALAGWPEFNDEIVSEMDVVIASDPHGPLARAALYTKAQIEVRNIHANPERGTAAAAAAVERYIATAPGEERGGGLLMSLAGVHEHGSAEQIAIYERVREQYPKRAGKWAAGKIRQATSVGQPFDLAFTCAVTGSEVDMDALRGKVVLIDFWATWCGPCVAEIPHLKELYAQYHDDGFEIIGVSLDQPEDKGGLAKLREFVAEREMPWPQYYQGNGWDSEFSMSWGVNGIPQLFIIDKEGKLRSVHARGKLDEMIPELLAEGAPAADRAAAR